MNPVANRGKAAQVIPFMIPAGGTVTVKATGSFLHIVESPVRVSVRFDSGGWVMCAPGTGLECTGDAFFEWAEITNPSAGTISILVYVGFARYSDSRLATMETPTAVVGQAATSLAGGGVVSLPGLPSGNFIGRKALVVSNLDVASRLTIKDGAGNSCATVFPATSVILPISGAVSVMNETSSAIACFVSEIWYVGSGSS